MKKLLLKIKNIERTTIIKNAFLLPILLVVAMSISHVIRWYDLGNPISWAVYLSVAVEIFALASVAAASIKMKKHSIWALFIIVTMIQIIGNVFFSYLDINLTDPKFLSWTEMIQPWTMEWTAPDHRRFLALIEGAPLPFMSLIALHFYIKFNENLNSTEQANISTKEDDTVLVAVSPEPAHTAPIKPTPFTQEQPTESEKKDSLNEEYKTKEVENELLVEIAPEIESAADSEEKEVKGDEIHITGDYGLTEEKRAIVYNDRERRRLHPARY